MTGDKAPENEGSDGKRTNAFLLANVEMKALRAIARKTPRWIAPDDLTILALIASFAICGAYYLSGESHLWLWLVNAMLIVHWLGDSLDGTLARVRKTERPKYGYYIDHIADAIAVTAIGLGLGLSPYMLLSVGILFVVMYLLLSINVYLESSTLGQFDISYGKLGPTEFRIILFLINVPLALGYNPTMNIFNVVLGPLNAVGVAVITIMLILLLSRIIRNLKLLAEKEPPPSRY